MANITVNAIPLRFNKRMINQNRNSNLLTHVIIPIIFFKPIYKSAVMTYNAVMSPLEYFKVSGQETTMGISFILLKATKKKRLK